MDFKTAYRSILTLKGYSIRGMANELGVSYGRLADALRTNNPYVSTTLQYVAPLGYNLVLVPEGAKLPNFSYVIDEFGDNGGDK